jgi:hypothetical protein
MDSAQRFLGIDFSGAAAPWRARCGRPTVWIAFATFANDRLTLDDLIPAQDLPGAGAPFHRLTGLLDRGDYAAAAIDAPFSIPAAHMKPGGHAALLQDVAAMPDGADRPFPRGAALVALAETVRLKDSAKPMRACERHWAQQGVNTRSTLWNGPRGGAPFAAACLTLIARAGRPCWPWQTAPHGLLVEAFPAAQLRRWSLPHRAYGNASQTDARREIIAGLTPRIALSPGQTETMHRSADALDAVIAVFAGLAVQRHGAQAPEGAVIDEGWIATG